MSGKSAEILCDACGQETFLLKKPIYDGFTKTGESFHCSSCGHTFADEESVPFKQKSKVEVFTAEDRSAEIKVFEEGENSRLCRYCRNYVVNPFMQWCGLNKKEVQATDSCDRFEEGSADDDEKKPVL